MSGSFGFEFKGVKNLSLLPGPKNPIITIFPSTSLLVNFPFNTTEDEKVLNFRLPFLWSKATILGLFLTKFTTWIYRRRLTPVAEYS